MMELKIKKMSELTEHDKMLYKIIIKKVTLEQLKEIVQVLKE
jgi:hypothetical protein